MRLLAMVVYISLAFIAESFSEDALLAAHGIKTRDLSQAQESVLVGTINDIGKMTPQSVAINGSVYKRLASFRRLFGFKFDGEKLRDWLLRRIKSVARENTWTIAVNENGGSFLLGDRFFEKSDFLERAYCLVHEARHSDGDGYPHVRCPDDFKYISAGAPGIDDRSRAGDAANYATRVV